MHAFSLHWFRSKQRAVARFVLAAFCLSWLQLAAMPCVMAAGLEIAMQPAVGNAQAMPVASDMPDGMVMAPGEHCPYCPPDTPSGTTGTVQDVCAFPHDPQVDSRAAFASALLAPPPVVVLFRISDSGHSATAEFDLATAPVPQARTPFAVTYCRFLK